jgi:hypothetical protein
MKNTIKKVPEKYRIMKHDSINMPSDEELIALWEQGGFEAIAKHAKATAEADCQKILLDAFLKTDSSIQE